MVRNLHATTWCFAGAVQGKMNTASHQLSSQMETEADGVSNTVRVTHRAVPSRHKKQQEKQLNTHINCSSFIDKHHTLSKKLWFLIRLGYTPDFHKKRGVGCNRNFCCHTPQWKSTNSMQHPVHGENVERPSRRAAKRLSHHGVRSRPRSRWGQLRGRHATRKTASTHTCGQNLEPKWPRILVRISSRTSFLTFFAFEMQFWSRVFHRRSLNIDMKTIRSFNLSGWMFFSSKSFWFSWRIENVGNASMQYVSL